METNPYMSQGQGALVVSTDSSRRDVFRRVAQRPLVDWPAYDSTPLYERSSLTALSEDIRTVSGVWFEHSAHNSVEGFVCQYPLSYVEFNPHDQYSGPTRYEMPQLFRAFLLKEIHGWGHETTLVQYLRQHSEPRGSLGFDSVPDQSTLWRSWNKRFSADLRETVERTARTLLINAQNAGVAVPRDPERKLQYDNDESGATNPDDQTVLEEAAKISDHVSRVVFPAFSLDRGEGCEIHENAYWGLQTYLGLRERLAANEGARSFVYESTRDHTKSKRKPTISVVGDVTDGGETSVYHPIVDRDILCLSKHYVGGDSRLSPVSRGDVTGRADHGLARSVHREDIRRVGDR